MRRTKIVCTLGPATEDPEILRELMLGGMDVVRFNFSHGTHESHLEAIGRVKQLRQELNLPVAILLDTKGPEIRLGSFPDGSVELKEGDAFCLTTEEIPGDAGRASVTYKELPRDVGEGSRILIDDGLVELAAEKVTETEIWCRVKNGGVISTHKGINIPNGKLSMPYMSDKDRSDILFGIENEVDFIAASFVREAGDIKELREFVNANGGSGIKLISKIENQQGVDNIDEILENSDGIMVARGDLGVEIPIQKIPSIQKMMIRKVFNEGKIVITATQMLDSMMKNPRPTRAEATDVANAIYDGTSAIMLSGETAAGKYPVEAVRTMVEIAECTEKDIDYDRQFRQFDKLSNTGNADADVTDAISHATCMTAIDIDAAAVVTVTRSGGTARMISRYRPKCPILGCTPSVRTYYQLNLSWGIKPLMIAEETDTERLFQSAMEKAAESGSVRKNETAVLTAGIPLGISGSTNLLRVMTAG